MGKTNEYCIIYGCSGDIYDIEENGIINDDSYEKIKI